MPLLVTVTMQANRTYKCRSVTLIRQSNQGEPVVGVVEIRESKSMESVVKKSRYALREEIVKGTKDRVFRLTKPGGGDRYYVCLPADPYTYPGCECVGFESYGWCRHIGGLQALATAGKL